MTKNRMKKSFVASGLLIAALSLSACSDDTKGGFPAAPSLGNQIDRMGRPAINTALTDPFWDDGMKTSAAHALVQDSYNQAAQSSWGNFTNQIRDLLAIYDGLDLNCGNQIAASSTLDVNRYGTLAGVLSDDQLYVNTASGMCERYLGVETNFLGVANSDCGGRTPSEDVIDTTYSALATGGLIGVGDDIGPDSSAQNGNFPFLGDPL